MIIQKEKFSRNWAITDKTDVLSLLKKKLDEGCCRTDAIAIRINMCGDEKCLMRVYILFNILPHGEGLTFAFYDKKWVLTD